MTDLLLVSSFSGLALHVSYNWRAMATKQFPSMQDVLIWTLQSLAFEFAFGVLFWLLGTYSGHGAFVACVGTVKLKLKGGDN